MFLKKNRKLIITKALQYLSFPVYMLLCLSLQPFTSSALLLCGALLQISLFI